MLADRIRALNTPARIEINRATEKYRVTDPATAKSADGNRAANSPMPKIFAAPATSQ